MAEPKPTKLEEFAKLYAEAEASRDDFKRRASSYRNSARDCDNEVAKLDTRLGKLRRQIAEETGLVTKVVRGTNARGDATIEPLTSTELAAIDKQIEAASPEEPINHSGRE